MRGFLIWLGVHATAVWLSAWLAALGVIYLVQAS